MAPVIEVPSTLRWLPAALTFETSPDPLVIVLAVFAIGVLLARLMFRTHPWWRVIVRVSLLILLTIALLRANIVPYQPLKSTGAPFLDVVHAVLKIAWWLWAAWFVVGLLRVSLLVEHQSHDRRLLQDLVSGLVYLAAGLAIVSFVLDLSISGLLATSGIIAIILGLALQSTLGDVFSGIVLNASHPYKPGNWVDIGGETSGRIIEINWRATHILTATRDLAIVPNSTIAKSKIVNLSSPSDVHGMTIPVQIAAGASPSATAELIQRAILNCCTILKTPAPALLVKTVSAAFTEFEISFFVKDLGSAPRAQNQLYDLIYRHLTLAGIDLAARNQAPSASTDDSPRSAPRSQAELMLDHVAIFAALPASERRAIAAKLKPKVCREGDALLEPGTVMRSLTFVGSGVLSYTREDGDSREELLRLGPADHFGEIGLLTQIATKLRVTALTPAVVYELSRDDLAPVLKAHPEITEALDHVLARRQATIDPPEPIEVDHFAPSRGFTSRIFDWLHHRYDGAASR